MASFFIVTSCDDDDDPVPLDRPAVTASTPSVQVTTGEAGVVSFNVNVPGGYASATASNGNLTSEPSVGATSGTVSVTFTPSSAGSTTIILTVTDQQSPAKTGEASAAVVATDPMVGAPMFDGIPATANITEGDTLRVPSVTLSADAGLASLAVSVNGNDVPDLAQDLSGAGTSVGPIEFSAPQTATFAPGNYTIVFTLTDANGATATFTHVLTIEARPPAPIVIVSENITEDMTWTADNIYELAGRIVVEPGAALTINAGTIIKGQGGTGVNASALLIARGAQIFARGTADSVIIFTSVSDQIQPGQIASPNLPASQNGLWGGLIVLGNAPSSVGANNTEAQIEGIPPSDTNGLYGGNVADDNSGVIEYISIRHGGANIGEGNEINGLTLGGVGSATTISHVEIVANQDDGLELFGGTVDVSNVLVWNAGDDAIDTDQDWIGTLDNFIVVAGDDTDHALELDGPEGNQRTPLGHTIQNGSVKGAPNAELANLRDSVELTLQNILFFGFPDPAVDGRGDFTMNNRPVATEEDPIDLTIENYTQFNTIVLDGLEVVLPAGVAIGDVFRDVDVEGEDADATAVDNVGAATVGATVSEFTSWTWADVAGGLADF